LSRDRKLRLFHRVEAGAIEALAIRRASRRSSFD
jgi:hypothetical protein